MCYFTPSENMALHVQSQSESSAVRKLLQKDLFMLGSSMCYKSWTKFNLCRASVAALTKLR